MIKRQILYITAILFAAWWVLGTGCAALPDPNCTHMCDRKLYYCYYKAEQQYKHKTIALVDSRNTCEEQDNSCMEGCYVSRP